jgi:HlyD family secretion protein
VTAPWRRLPAVATWLAATLSVGCSPPADPGWSGYAEGDYVYVAAPLAGRLTALPAVRGIQVVAGAPLFVLDAENETAARDEAAARVDVARAQAENTTKGRRADEVAVTQAQLQQARANAVAATAELTRQTLLLAQGFISAARLDDARAAAQAANARVAELEAALRVARLPARDDERRAARAGAAAAEQALAQAAWRTAQKQQSAPQAGQVADTFFRVGEWVGAGQPVVSLLPAGATRARFFVPEAALASLAIGQPVTLRCDGCGAPLHARIDFIATQAEYTPPVIYSNAQRARLVFMVEARPLPADAARLKPGQPLDVHRVEP